MDKIKLLNIFTTENDLRKWMKNPFKKGEFIVAANPHSMIRMKDDKTISAEDDVPFDIFKPFDKIFHEPTLIQIEKIKKLILTIPEIDETSFHEGECMDCSGTGGGVCSLDHFHECEATDCEDGIVTIEFKTGKKIKDPKYFIRLEDSFFCYDVFSKLIEACEIMGCDKINKIYGSFDTPNIFEFKGIEIIIMPAYRNGNKPFLDLNEAQ